MTLRIPPAHPLAAELYDLQCIQNTIIAHMNPTDPLYDSAKQEKYAETLELVDDSIRFVQGQYRAERGADDICSVSLTYSANGFPLVDGRSSNGAPFIHPGAPKPPIYN